MQARPLHPRVPAFRLIEERCACAVWAQTRNDRMKPAIPCGLWIPALLAALACSPLCAQDALTPNALPDAPASLLAQNAHPAASDHQSATLFGTVTTSGGDTVVVGATVTLENSAT